MLETLGVLAAWTPFLLEGLLTNFLITAGAMLFGTTVGFGLAHLRTSSHRGLTLFGSKLTALCQNVPTLILLFFTASVIPTEIHISGTFTILIPAWLKALLALSTSPIGIVSDNATVAIRARRANQDNAYLLMLPAWTNSLLITFLASSLVSLIGVSEIVSRANVVIGATGASHLAAVFFYVSLIFLACAYPMTRASQALSQRVRAGKLNFSKI